MKNGSVRPYEDGKFTYQIGDMVLMGHFFENVKKQGGHITYRDFLLEYISYQYNHIVIAYPINLIEIKTKKGELMIWKMTESEHEGIMDNFIYMSHYIDE